VNRPTGDIHEHELFLCESATAVPGFMLADAARTVLMEQVRLAGDQDDTPVARIDSLSAQAAQRHAAIGLSRRL
jgi:hypothetical protein